LLDEIGTLHLDRATTTRPAVRQRLATYGINDLDIQQRGTTEPHIKQPMGLGLRWIVEATNSWWSNHGQLHRNTDRRGLQRHSALYLATTVLIVGRLIDWRNRWSPQQAPIR
jgi:hypothetical protein